MITEIIAPEIERSQFSAPQGEPRDEEANNRRRLTENCRKFSSKNGSKRAKIGVFGQK